MDGRQVKRDGTVSFRGIFGRSSDTVHFPFASLAFPFFTRRAISQVTWPIDPFFEEREFKVFLSCDEQVEQGNIGRSVSWGGVRYATTLRGGKEILQIWSCNNFQVVTMIIRMIFDVDCK